MVEETGQQEKNGKISEIIRPEVKPEIEHSAVDQNKVVHDPSGLLIELSEVSCFLNVY